MNKENYSVIENYMLSCMEDSAHDKEHVYRVLYNALAIAKSENDVDYNVLICACLLHDVGRKEQFENPKLCHATVGGEKAERFLMEKGFSEDYVEKVKHCIQTHRFRQNNQPQSIEAKILFDADKLENLYSKFYTQKGMQMAEERQQAAVDFYNSIYHEVEVSYENGRNELGKIIE